jgi:hypothetical protein
MATQKLAATLLTREPWPQTHQDGLAVSFSAHASYHAVVKACLLQRRAWAVRSDFRGIGLLPVRPSPCHRCQGPPSEVACPRRRFDRVHGLRGTPPRPAPSWVECNWRVYECVRHQVGNRVRHRVWRVVVERVPRVRDSHLGAAGRQVSERSLALEPSRLFPNAALGSQDSQTESHGDLDRSELGTGRRHGSAKLSGAVSASQCSHRAVASELC